MQILDCTLRDGGYYTNWDFEPKLVREYLEAFNELPVDYLEIGYRSKPQKGYYGEYFYLPKYLLEEIRAISNKKLVIILNEKDVRAEDATAILTDCVGIIDLVRIAIDPKNFTRALELAAVVKSMGFEVGFNVMYMSTWQDNPDFLGQLDRVNDLADYFYMVDSFGGVYPEDVKHIYGLVSKSVKVPIGFHGHNNLELALVNTLTAIDCGASIVDATVTGMGRGAGNLKTELLLTSMSAKDELKFDFNALSKTVDGFSRLQEAYRWGTNLPYMFSGANSLPQKDVMDWVGKRYYSFNSIIRALQNQTDGLSDNLKLPVISPKQKFSSALVIGGGPSVMRSTEAIRQYIDKNKDTLVIHASSKHASEFRSISNSQVFCLVGNEGHRMEQVFQNELPTDAICVLPPYPRKMGTYIPEKLKNGAVELGKSTISSDYPDSHTALALETALEYGVAKVRVVGYDGYDSSQISIRERELFQENEYLFEKATARGLVCSSLTPTSYSQLIADSIFSSI